MIFNSLTFLVFFAALLCLYHFTPLHRRWAILLLAGCVYYAWLGTAALGFLLAISVVTYSCGLGMGASGPATRKSWFLAGIVSILAVLVGFKFYDFVAGELERFLGLAEQQPDSPVLPRLGMATPAGLSFYAFMAVSYLADVYSRKLEPDMHAGRVALYVSYFPKIMAGPIERATTFLPQLKALPRVQPDLAVLGLQLILWGFFKKVVIADNLAPVVDKTFKIMAYASPVDLLISWYFFAFQIYCDFSGYSDIAIGTSLLLGIRLMENFRRPYLSVSTAEFWSGRWHISLSRWFRDYLYFPLGGSKRGLPRQYLNTMVVFIISGLWHSGLGYGIGWNFMVWGALNGFYQWMGLATRGLWRAAGTRLPSIAQSGVWHGLRILFTFHLILLSWVFFRAGSIEQAVIGLRKVAASAASLPKVILNYPFTTEHMFGAALIAFLFLVELLDEKKPLTARLAELPRPLRWGIYYTLLAGLLLLGRWQSQQFIYMQF